MNLKGITWAHTRGKLPVLATAQRYMELHPEVTISWDARSLKEFGDAPIDKLAHKYDLIILDHPWMGFANDTKVLLPLENYLDAPFLEDQKINSVGKSFESYLYNGHQFALAIDAACPIAFYSADKLAADADAKVPATWADVIALAQRGKVYCGGNGTSILMQFYMLMATKTDAQIFTIADEIAPYDIMKESLIEVKELFSYLPDSVFSKNPIGVYEVLADPATEQYYCPCDFGYSNYSRRGYSTSKIIATDVVTYNGNMLKTTLGGAGFAISAKCKNIDLAIDYLKFTASAATQKTIYSESGGQPGHRAAWLDAATNSITSNFFANTLKTLDNAYLRPRYNGYLGFQETAGPMIREWIMKGTNVDKLISKLQHLYAQSKN
ncbi:extracellular solute-binding protein [Candidatus Epulonipiscium viviparus]|uniref:extracellular solute-binding protein n=1 Tax=Candidatus Epulonipiscium viviparus TaxID=420336 RepID=UPI0027381630|nr:extracellular solute-binding protein [Candidatus Epulopiscium viviparus]